MNKLAKKVVFFLIAFIIILPLMTFQSNQASASTTQDLPFGTKTTGNITDSDPEQMYKIVLNGAGRITVNLDSYMDETYLDLIDDQGNYVWHNEDIYYGRTDDPKKWSGWEDLEPGTYYIRVHQYNSSTGKYDLSVTYDQAYNTDKEPNNGTLQAQELTLNTQKVTGFISWNDDTDYYKIHLDKAGRITVNLDSYMDETYLDLIDDQGNYVWHNEDIYYGRTDDPKKWSDWEDLEPGTYYIKVHQYNNSTGKYVLSAAFNQANNTDKEPNNGTLQAQELKLNTQKVTGFISWNDDTDYYKIHLDKAGRITVNLDSYIYETYLDLIDDQGNSIWHNEDIYYGSFNNPKKWSGWEDLEPGTYYIKVHQYSNSTGKYVLSAAFNQANNTDKEPNNGTPQAQTLALNTQKVTGFISWNDDEDYYKFTLPKAGTITVRMDSYIYDTYLDLIDNHGNKIWSNKDIYYGAFNNPKKWFDTETLSAGTYYIRVHQYSSSTGKYSLRVDAPFLLPALSVNTVSNKSTTVTGKTSKDSTVYVKVGSKTYHASVNSKGEYKQTIAKQQAGAKIEVTAANKYGSKKMTVTVVDRIPPTTPVVYSINSKSKYITGKAEPYSTVVATIGNHKIGSAKADKYGKYKIKMTPRKKGTFIKVAALDKAGNKSSYKTIKVK